MRRDAGNRTFNVLKNIFLHLWRTIFVFYLVNFLVSFTKPQVLTSDHRPAHIFGAVTRGSGAGRHTPRLTYGIIFAMLPDTWASKPGWSHGWESSSHSQVSTLIVWVITSLCWVSPRCCSMTWCCMNKCCMTRCCSMTWTPATSPTHSTRLQSPAPVSSTRCPASHQILRLRFLHQVSQQIMPTAMSSTATTINSRGLTRAPVAQFWPSQAPSQPQRKTDSYWCPRPQPRPHHYPQYQPHHWS